MYIKYINRNAKTDMIRDLTRDIVDIMGVFCKGVYDRFFVSCDTCGIMMRYHGTAVLFVM